MVVEVSQFRLVDGTDEDEFLRAAEQTQAGFLARQDGFLGRELMRGQDGWWLDVVRFASEEAAQAAFASFNGDPNTHDFEQMLDMQSATMSHWTLTRTWERAVR